MAVHAREKAEKACQIAEELFLAGNIHEAHRQAKKAKRLCPSLPGVENALAAYEVHIHAAERGDWRAVLGIGPADDADATQLDAVVKKQFRRLSLLVHPDKAQYCAAAQEAFRLLREAHDEALSAPPPAPSCSASADRDTSTPRPASTSEGDGAVDDDAAAGARAARARPHVIYCPYCENEFRGMVGRLERRAGMRCAFCPAWLNTPWPTKPPTEKKPPAAPGRQVFQCPAKCPGCGERYTSMVCVGPWCLQCKACSKAAMVDVHGPDDATASSTRRA